MSDLRAKMTADGMTCFIMDILGNEVKSDEENMFGEEGDAKIDPADVSGSGSNYP